MANPRESQQELSRDDPQNDAVFPQNDSETQDVSRQQDSPQRGEQQSDYQTREANSNSGENFYQNRERGNYTEGQGSDEGGGSLY